MVRSFAGQGQGDVASTGPDKEMTIGLSRFVVPLFTVQNIGNTLRGNF